VIDGDDRGTGTGSVRYHFGANSGRSRTARIEVRDHDTSCTITQAGVLPDAAPEGTAWTSHLDVSGARAEVIVDGVAVAVQERGVFLGRTGAQGVHRVEARLVQAAGRPGLWRFEIGGGAPAGLRPLEGNVVQVSEGQVTFRLEGRPGERVAFTWRSR
jgi:hypothetical protein